MPIVRHTLKSPVDDTPLEGAEVTIEVRSNEFGRNIAYLGGSDGGVIGPTVPALLTDAAGYWEADLHANDDFVEENTYYRISQRHPELRKAQVDEVIVPDVAGPIDLASLIPAGLSGLPAPNVMASHLATGHPGWGGALLFPATVVKPSGFFIFGFSITSQTWADWPTNDGGSVSDIVVDPVAVGDKIEVNLAGSWFPNTTDVGYIDVVSVVAGSPVRSIIHKLPPDNGAVGEASWLGGLVGTNPDGFGGSCAPYVVQADDIESGSLTLRLQARCDDGMGGPPSGPRIIFCTGAYAEFNAWARHYPQ